MTSSAAAPLGAERDFVPAGEVGATDSELLGLESAAFASFARILGQEVELLASGQTLGLLIETLIEIGATDAADTLTAMDEAAISNPEELTYAWTMLFARGTVPPYETSYMTPSMVGHTNELADIAAFYRAFGLEVVNERSDHLLPELEFASLAALRESQAVDEANQEAFEVVHSARATFMRDHLGCWVDEFVERLEREEPENRYLPVVEALAFFIGDVCDGLGIEPFKPVIVPTPGLGDIDIDSDDSPVVCFGDPVPIEDLEMPADVSADSGPLSVRPVRRS
ncbi:MAG: hypothetical protein DCC49_12055 [Acidobacteria bacterium]|nr:MAG: hypothetical protein DCC49_12055 [Acidobacteriota bacterium]